MSNKKKEKTQEVVEEIKFSGAAYRLKNESFEEYKARQKMLKALQKQALKGKVLWPSHIMGTYYRSYKGKEEEIINKVINLYNDKKS